MDYGRKLRHGGSLNIAETTKFVSRHKVMAAAKLFRAFRRKEVSLPNKEFGVRFGVNEVDPHLVAIGNVAPALAEEEGQPYTTKQAEQLPSILEAVHTVFERQSGKQLPQGVGKFVALRSAVLKELSAKGVDLVASGFQATPEDYAREADFNMLLQYMLLVAHRSLVNKPLPLAKRAGEDEAVTQPPAITKLREAGKKVGMMAIIMQRLRGARQAAKTLIR